MPPTPRPAGSRLRCRAARCGFRTCLPASLEAPRPLLASLTHRLVNRESLTEATCPNPNPVMSRAPCPGAHRGPPMSSHGACLPGGQGGQVLLASAAGPDASALRESGAEGSLPPGVPVVASLPVTSYAHLLWLPLPHPLLCVVSQGDDGPDVRGGSGDILLVHATETDRKGRAVAWVWELSPKPARAPSTAAAPPSLSLLATSPEPSEQRSQCCWVTVGRAHAGHR